MRISAVIICLNEERNLGRALQSLQGVADEILIMDSGSTDGSEAIAKAFNAQFISLSWEGYAATKNRGNLKASGDYILSLDADEALSEELRSSIKTLKTKEQSEAFAFNRLSNYCGKWIRHSGWYPDTKVRLFPKGKALWEGSFVHEILVPDKEIKIRVLNGDLHHYSYYTRAEHIAREKKYARLAAAQDREAGKGANAVLAALKAAFRFMRMYIFKAGFLDGREGFHIAVISARGKIWRNRFLMNAV